MIKDAELRHKDTVEPQIQQCSTCGQDYKPPYHLHICLLVTKGRNERTQTRHSNTSLLRNSVRKGSNHN